MGMTVSELILHLQKCPPDAEVIHEGSECPMDIQSVWVGQKVWLIGTEPDSEYGPTFGGPDRMWRVYGERSMTPVKL